MQSTSTFRAGEQQKNQFISNGYLDMDKIIEKFILHFNDIYGSQTDKFKEEEGRKLFLLYLRPIINGVGNYYIEPDVSAACYFYGIAKACCKKLQRGLK